MKKIGHFKFLKPFDLMKNALLVTCLFVISAVTAIAQPHRETDPIGGIDTTSIIIGLVIGLIVGYLLGSRMSKK